MEKRKGRPKKSESNKFTTECTIKDPLIEPFYIQKDNYNWTVIEVTTSTRGFGGKKMAPKEVEKTIGYYTSFRNALNCVAKHKFYENENEFTSIKSYIDSWEKVKTGIETLLNTTKEL